MEELSDIVDSCLARLMEHGEAIQILITGTDGQGHTWSMARGEGNWYARQGLAHEFINADVAQEHARKMSEAFAEEEEGL